MKNIIVSLFIVLFSVNANATGFTDYGNDIISSTLTRYEINGDLRVRSEAMNNFDLDRGKTPSGESFFPTSISDPKKETLYYSDMRLRTDFSMFAPGGIVAVKVRIDILDNISIGGGADGIPGGTITQKAPEDAFVIKRAYGEVITPIGYFAAGRMGHHWGLGMLGNGGECLDCDSGDSADRIAYIAPVYKHILAIAYDFSSTGFLVDRKIKDNSKKVDIEPSSSVRTLSFGILNWRDDATKKRRKKVKKSTFEYGFIYALRWQEKDIPAAYLPSDEEVEITSSQIMDRNLNASVFNLWLKLTHPYMHIEMEAAYVEAELGQLSLLPGLKIPQKVKSKQFGGVIESEFGDKEKMFTAGLDLGYASGDPAPGFGATSSLDDINIAKPGDLNGVQISAPNDLSIENFQFHPDYHVDKILFKEIIGTVTDAFYLRPHVRFKLLDFGSARLNFITAGIISWTNFAASAPGNEKLLGAEIDPSLTYHSDDGFIVALDYAILFPFAGLNNIEKNLSANSAQLLKLRVTYGF